MSGSIEIPFAIGETVWWVGNGHRKDRVVCPECAGSKVIRLLKGNGEEVGLDCAACQVGYDPSTGTIEVTSYQYKPTPFVCRRVRIEGKTFSYSESSPDSTCYSSVDSKMLFRDEGECLKQCEKLSAERTQAEKETHIACIASKRRSMAYSATYWSRKAKELERELELARERLATCKERDAKKAQACADALKPLADAAGNVKV